MIVVTVLYPTQAGSRFDQTYYMQKHMPLVRSRWKDMGLQEARVLRGAGTPDGSAPPFQMMAVLTFSSLQDFQACAAKHGAEIFADVPNFTNIQPVVQLNEPLG